MKHWYPSEWGAGDELGAFNRITSSTILSALRLASEGRVYQLGRVMEHEMPQFESHRNLWCNTEYDFELSSEWMKRHFPEMRNGYSDVTCRISTCDHVATHIDNLNHASVKEGRAWRVYNGLDGKEITTSFGTKKLGGETMVPVISRGVLIDVARLKRTEMLKPGYVISVDDLASSLSRQEIDVREGDTVLLHTGWGKLWMRDNQKWLGKEPGPGKEAGRWLAEKGIILIGADNWGLDVFPFELPTEVFPLHVELIVKRGIRILENLSLGEIARDEVYEFLFICLPLRIRGATGSPIAPVAVV